MSRAWRNRIEQALVATIRYVFPDAEGNSFHTPDAVELESFTQYLLSLVEAERKRAFFAGYESCGVDAASENSTVVFSRDENRIGAERRFCEWDREE